MAVLIVLLLAGVVALVGAPLRRRHGPQQGTPTAGEAGEARDGWLARGSDPALDDLEAAREAKYREIRDAELDYRTGKLSAEDYGSIDADLRTEALEILDRIERARGDAETPGSDRDDEHG